LKKVHLAQMSLGQAQSKHTAAKTRLEAANKNKAALAANIDQSKNVLNQQKYVPVKYLQCTFNINVSIRPPPLSIFFVLKLYEMTS